MNFLIIEDDLFLWEKLSQFLNRKSIVNFVKNINSYNDFISEIVDLKIYDVVLLDLFFDWKNRWIEILKIIRDKNKFIPIIIMTWYNDLRIMESSFLLWANDFLFKPFRRDELYIRVNRWFHKYLHSFYYKEENKISYNWLYYDEKQNTFFFDNKEIKLSKTKKYILLFFLLNNESYISKDFLLNKLYWNIDSENKNIRIFIMRLKNSLSDYWLDSWLQNIRWEWYIFKK